MLFTFQSEYSIEMAELSNKIQLFSQSKLLVRQASDLLNSFGVDNTVFTKIEEAEGDFKSNNYLYVLYLPDDNNLYNFDFLEKIKSADNKALRILWIPHEDIKIALQVVNEGLANHILTGTASLKEIPAIIDRTLKDNFALEEELLKERLESFHDLKKWDDTLRSSLKARTQSFLTKRRKLESIHQELKNNLFETIKALFSYLERKNHWIGRHCKMVAALSMQLAKELRLPESEVEAIEIAALLHDIGKIGIPDKVVSKSSHLLTKKQFELAAKHVEFGKDILAPIISLKEVGTIILHHHEHFDGRGRPDRLKGEEIPQGSRIIAVVDTFANISEKSYSKVKTSTAKALKEVYSKGGTILDPNIVDRFLDMMQEAQKRKTEKMWETQISLDELEAGLMLSRDIFSSRGTKVLRSGQILTDQHIDYILEFDTLEKLFGEIYVYKKEHKEASSSEPGETAGSNAENPPEKTERE